MRMHDATDQVFQQLVAIPYKNGETLSDTSAVLQCTFKITQRIKFTGRREVPRPGLTGPCPGEDQDYAPARAKRAGFAAHALPGG